MNDERLKTFGDWEELYYQRLAKSLGVENQALADLIFKDDTVVSSTTGVYTALYGARVHNNLYWHSPAWQILPKIAYQDAKSGVRLLTTAPTNTAAVTETGALVATDKPDVIQYSITPTRMNTTWDITEIAQARSLAEDGKGGGEAAWMADAMGEYFLNAIDTQLLSKNGTTANGKFESIDRMIANQAEITNCLEQAGSTSYTTHDCDIYSQDRDSTSTTDAYVSYSTTNTVMRALYLSLVDELMVQTQMAGAKPENQVFLTRHDTFGDWGALLASQQRFTDYVELQPSFAGVASDARGRQAGVRAAVYQGVPIMLDKNVISDGAGRIYLIDSTGVEFRMLNPVRHLSSGVNDAIIHDAFIERHSLDIAGELTALKFATHGKIRDLA